jgi:hypothetical protein
MRSMLNPIKRLVGAIDYFRCPELREEWGGPFNGQRIRQRLFEELVKETEPVAIVETGTFRGSSTEFMSKTGLPIFSIELSNRNYGYCRSRLWRYRNVTLWCGDSRTGLQSLKNGALRKVLNQTVFVYLDAHWNEDLPLAEELEVVFSDWPSAIVMVDDFQVPHDAGYSYDNYGPNKALILTSIAIPLEKHQIEAFYPSTPSKEESGSRRGCVVLAKSSIHGATLLSMPLLTGRSGAVAHSGSLDGITDV